MEDDGIPPGGRGYKIHRALTVIILSIVPQLTYCVTVRSNTTTAGTPSST